MFLFKNKLTTVAISIILAASTAAIFWQVHGFDFINYDDNTYVYENSHVLNGLTAGGVIWAFTSFHLGYWQPLTWLSLMLDCQLFGLSPGSMHLANLFLHVLNSLLVFTLFRKMTGSLWPSAFVGAAFALHPMHIQSVAWIAERKDVLSTLFWLLTLIVYAGYVKRPTVFRYSAALVIFAVGLLAKPMLVTLPFILLLLDYWPLNRFAALKTVKVSSRRSGKSAPIVGNRRILNRILIEKIPFLLVAVISSVITFLTQRVGGGIVDVTTVPLMDRVANVFLSYAVYIGKMFWPSNLAVFYPFDAGQFAFWQVALCALLVFAILLFVIYARKKQQYLLVGWFWFVGTLIPVIGLIQFTGSSYADRYTYIPYIGLFIMIAWGAPELVSALPFKKVVIGSCAVALLTALAISTNSQLEYWKNSSAIFTHAIAVTHRNYVAHYNLACELQKKGYGALALDHYKKAVEIRPYYADAAVSAGCIIAEQQGDINQAIEYFRKAVQAAPDSVRAHFNLGIALQKRGNLGEAVAHYRQVVRLDPEIAEAQYALGKSLFLEGNFSEAVIHIKSSLESKPDNIDAQNNLAWILATCADANVRNPSEAIKLAQAGCAATDYNVPVLLGTLAAAYASADRFTDAIETAQKALSLVKTDDTNTREALQRHLAIYKKSKPYIDKRRTQETQE
jgi:tetratricopeptide (TPR) repeat protein